MSLALFAMFSFLVGMADPQTGAVPVEDEPHHKTVLKNDYVQAFRVVLQPGEASLMHIHAHDDAAVRLRTATITMDSPGEPAGPPQVMQPGVVSARNNEPKALTHRVNNVGSTIFEVIDVQALKRPAGPESAAIAPPAAENPRMRVYRYELEPGASTEPHTHARPYLFVAATDTDLRVASTDGVSRRQSGKAGGMDWVVAPVTHTLTNDGAAKTIVVEIEIK